MNRLRFFNAQASELSDRSVFATTRRRKAHSYMRQCQIFGRTGTPGSGRFRFALLSFVLLISGLLGSISSAVAADEMEQKIDASVNRALEWLAKEQQPSGAWRSESYGESTAATSLAVMAFMAAGHVPEEGPYGRHISKGIAWVLS